MSIENEIQRLELRIKDLRKELEQEKRERLESVVPIRRFTIGIVKETFHEVWDDSIVCYRLTGEVANLDECIAARHKNLSNGEGMTYYYNSLSGKLAMSTGGGTLWISDWGKTENVKESFQKVLKRLSEFISENVWGGDVTDIVNEHRKEKE